MECTITDGHRDGGPLTLTARLQDSSSTVMEQPADHADARITGDTRAWVSAFSPGGKTASLEINGDNQLAEYMLGQLVRMEMQSMDSADRAVA